MILPPKIISIPWTEKYRPDNLDEILSHNNTISILKKYISSKYLPNILFYGHAGTGKTSTITAYAKELYGEMYNTMVLEINASDERGIEVVRNKIKPFIMTKAGFFDNTFPFKLVILDEADSLTQDAQGMLRIVIEKYIQNARFCFICNYIKNINPAIISRCMMFKFAHLKKDDMQLKILEIADSNNIKISESGIDYLIKLSGGDMRKLLNILQTMYYANFKKIRGDNICNCLGYPSKSNMTLIYSILTSKDSLNNIFNKLNIIITDNSYNLIDIIKELTLNILNKYFCSKITDVDVKKYFLQLSEIELHITINPNEITQLLAIISIFI